MAYNKPRVIYSFSVKRRPYWRRALWMLLATVAAAAAWVALDYAAGNEDVDPDLLRAGQIVAVFAIIMLSYQFLRNLLRAIRLRSESARFFDKGFTWTRGKETNKYSWSQLKAFRAGANAIRLGRFTLLQYGSHRLTMNDGETYRFGPLQGDMRRFGAALRPYVADATGTRIGRALRAGKSVKLHPKLVITGAGLVVGKNRIRWANVDVRIKRNKLVVSQQNSKGSFKPVKRYDTRSVDNLAGFLDVAHSTIRNHQPQRFNIQTHQ
jgi:hypothetical protein